jgi:hypothetical protein
MLVGGFEAVISRSNALEDMEQFDWRGFYSSVPCPPFSYSI